MADPLTRNDTPGAYPASWYADTAPIPPERPALRGTIVADVCIIGAGYAGLSAALALREEGLSVAVLEANRAGWGASGRNGGQMQSGYNRDQRWLAGKLGADHARLLWGLAEEAKALTRDQVARYAPDAALTPGVAHGSYSQAETDDLACEADFLARSYGYDQIDILDTAGFRPLVKSPLYQGGWLDRGAAHLHPLRYALGLAGAAEAAGAQIFERSRVHSIRPGKKPVAQTDAGRVECQHIIVAGNGYLPGILRPVAARAMPINSFIAATEPLDDPDAVLTGQIACSDSKFIVNYFRMSEDNRLLFGGRESYSIAYPKDIAPRISTRLAALFPQLSGIGFSHVWGGTLSITSSRLPLLTMAGENVLSVGGFSGHGVALSALSGRIAAEAVQGKLARWDALAALPTAPFPGGLLRAPLLRAAMSWYAMRDRLGV